MNKLVSVIAVAGIAASASAETVNGANAAPIEWGFIGTSPVDSGPATLFPSEINIAGASGAILDVNVMLLDGTHTWISDLEITLVSPSGTAVRLLDLVGTGNSDDLAGDLGFDDEAAGQLPATTGSGFTGSGVFQPTDVEMIDASGVAPTMFGGGLSMFDGEDANGTWSLYVFDEFGGDTGAINGGWTIEIEVVPAPASAALLGLGGLAAVRRRR